MIQFIENMHIETANEEALMMIRKLLSLPNPSLFVEGPVKEVVSHYKDAKDEVGSPYDRGRADAYYGRRRNPHWQPRVAGKVERIGCDRMTIEQVDEYNMGYDSEDSIKDYGHEIDQSETI